jgi:hypothetical protein
MLHRMGHLDGLQCKHILQNVMVSSERLLYTDRTTQFQQDYSSVHDTRVVVHEWLSLQADVELINCLPRAPIMKPIPIVWVEVKRKIQQETWAVIPFRTVMTFGTLRMTLGRQPLLLSLMFDHRVRMKSVVEVQEFSNSHLKRSVSFNGHFKVWNTNSNFLYVSVIFQKQNACKSYTFYTYFACLQHACQSDGTRAACAPFLFK